MEQKEPWPDNYEDALQRVVRWHTVLAGRVLGSRAEDDPQCKGYRDIFDKMILLRVEMTAMTGLLLEKGIFTMDEFMEKCRTEAEELDKMYEKQFPGVQTHLNGIVIDPQVFVKTTRGWPA